MLGNSSPNEKDDDEACEICDSSCDDEGQDREGGGQNTNNNSINQNKVKLEESVRSSRTATFHRGTTTSQNLNPTDTYYYKGLQKEIMATNS